MLGTHVECCRLEEPGRDTYGVNRGSSTWREEAGLQNLESNLVGGRRQQKQINGTYLSRVRSAASFRAAESLGWELICATCGFQHQMNEKERKGGHDCS